ncbi:hypothetical protein [Phaffia rhodozyma]|uniref:Uncharacterized protein n=1 Tax=Phaffia rhodozyma TaxID=264483 RepID=A0A0F7SKU1_PHARH|nr:hypothetical protein [Phaffia rhodozyma]
MAKGSAKSKAASLTKSLASTTLEPRKEPKPKTRLPVNELLGLLRQQERRSIDRSSLDQPFIPPSSALPLAVPSRLHQQTDVGLAVLPASVAPPVIQPAQAQPRRPAGPPPPRSWTERNQSSVRPARSSNKPKTRASFALSAEALTSFRSFTELVYPNLQVYYPPSFPVSESSSSASIEDRHKGQEIPRLVALCMARLSSKMSSSVIDRELVREELGLLPQHLRELLGWWIGTRAAQAGYPGLKDEGIEMLMWDLREWENSEDDDDDDDDDDGESSLLSSTSIDDENEKSWEDNHLGRPGYSGGWRTLYLPNSTVSLSMLKLLLRPLPTQPVTLTPVTSLCLSNLVNHSLPSLITVFPAHLRVLDLQGIKLFIPGGWGTEWELEGEEEAEKEGDGECARWGWWTVDRESRVINMLRKFASAVPLLQHLNISYTIPALKATHLASLPWTSSSSPCWSSLLVLRAHGLIPGDLSQCTSRGEARKDLMLRTVRQGMKGRKGDWVDVFV